MSPRQQSAYDVEQCPNCESNFWVDGNPNINFEWICHGCGEEFGRVSP